MIKRKTKIPINITSKDNNRDQDVGLILIMSGQKKVSEHVNQIYIKKIYQTKFWVDNTKTYQIFGVPIGNTKITRKSQFHPAAPVIKYHQKTYNSCC